jgi:GNAT superfamily N-acetyltransferase
MTIHIRTMTIADVPAGMRLKTEAGWNQTEADWHRMLSLQPEGCFVAELEGRPVGTTTTCVFDSVGWIAMVLVEKAARGKGIGTSMMRHALAYLDGCEVRTARLDATSLGRPVYEPLGFVAEYELARWTGVGAGGQTAACVAPVSGNLMESVYQLDCRITGTNRRRLLEQFLRERPDALLSFTDCGHIAGYTWIRPGERFTEIGPAVALDPTAGLAILDAAMARCEGKPVVVDIPIDNRPAMEWAERHGLAVQRTFTRMSRGQRIQDLPQQLWASSGPEKG